MKLFKILKRDLGSHMAVSRNMREGAWTKTKRYFWCVVYLVKALKIGISSIRHEQLGSRVFYEGRECFVSNWAGGDLPTLCDDNGWYQEYCDRKKITNRKDVKELWHRFIVGFDWYMSGWHRIDVEKRIV